MLAEVFEGMAEPVGTTFTGARLGSRWMLAIDGFEVDLLDTRTPGPDNRP